MSNNKLHFLPLGFAAAVLATACASIGRPDGGPRDETPPVFVSSTPEPGQYAYDGQRITIRFDENVQLDNPSEKVVVSPPQIQMPAVSANGHTVTVILKDSLKPNTTYTIDLADAVKDLNEGNVLDGLAIDFSTGNEVDTLRISGMVLEARTLEPAQGMLVGVYSVDADSLISTTIFERVAKTNQLGQFSIRNLKPGNYKIYAVKDMNRDYHWDRTEDVAFYDTLLSPSAVPVLIADTLLSSLDEDSVVMRRGIRYLPDDVLLTWFNEDYRAQYLKEYNRTDRRILSLEMGAPVDSLPQLTIIASGSEQMRVPVEQVSVLERSLTSDTLHYWLKDTAMLRSDSLLVETRYRKVDSLDNIVWSTDTLKFFTKRLRGKKAQEAAAKLHVRTLQEKIDSVLSKSDTIPIDTFLLSQPDAWLSLKVSVSGSQDLHKPLYLDVDQPLSAADTSAIHLEMMRDSVWQTVSNFVPALIPADSVSVRRFRIDYDWIPEMKYRITVDSMALHGIYPVYNRPLAQEFTAKSLDDYSTIVFNITGLDSIPAIVELLNAQDTPVASAPVEADGRCRLKFIAPGTYYARLYLDADRNGKYTVGDLLGKRQPEETYYFSKKLTLRKNWDMEQNWDIYELPVDLQKPLEIKKNKPKEKASDRKDRNGRNQYDDEEEDEEEEFGTGFGNTGFGSNSGFRSSRR